MSAVFETQDKTEFRLLAPGDPAPWFRQNSTSNPDYAFDTAAGFDQPQRRVRGRGVSFPEYGPRAYKAPAGGAGVFSCALLHAVSKVSAGRRFAFLPLLYDDAAAKIREENNRFLADGGTVYKA